MPEGDLASAACEGKDFRAADVGRHRGNLVPGPCPKTPGTVLAPPPPRGARYNRLRHLPRAGSRGADSCSPLSLADPTTWGAPSDDHTQPTLPLEVPTLLPLRKPLAATSPSTWPRQRPGRL